MQNIPVKLPRASMGTLGVKAANARAFLQEATRLGLHSFLFLHHGKVACEGYWHPFTPGTPHMLHSLSKAFTSTAAGFAVQEGLISLDDPIIRFFPEFLPCAPCENMQKLTLRHMLTMNTGHLEEPVLVLQNRRHGCVQDFLRSYVPLAPGTGFLYNTDATYVVSALLQKLTGKTVYDYLKPRLFEPLGFGDCWWDTCPDGINYGGFGFNLAVEDIAKFGQFLLQRGVWDGKQLLNAEWIDMATSCQVPTFTDNDPDWNQGYGFQFWRGTRPGVYRGDGARGQFCLVSPMQDAVFAANCQQEDMQVVLDAVYRYLLEPLTDDAIAQDAEEQQYIAEAATLSVLAPEGDAHDSKETAVSGIGYALNENDFGIRRISFSFGAQTEVTFETEDGAFTLPVGFGRYEPGVTNAAPRNPINSRFYRDCACAGAWVDGSYRLSIRYTGGTVRDEMKITFLPHGISLFVSRIGSFIDADKTILGIAE